MFFILHKLVDLRDRKRRKRRENIAKNTQSDSLTGTKLLIQSNPIQME